MGPLAGTGREIDGEADGVVEGLGAERDVGDGDYSPQPAALGFGVVPGHPGVVEGLHRGHQAGPVFIRPRSALAGVEAREEVPEGDVHVDQAVDGSFLHRHGEHRFDEEAKRERRGGAALHPGPYSEVVEHQGQRGAFHGALESGEDELLAFGPEGGFLGVARGGEQAAGPAVLGFHHRDAARQDPIRACVYFHLLAGWLFWLGGRLVLGRARPARRVAAGFVEVG